MTKSYFDESGQYVIEDYASWQPFASFLPGIAGPSGIPMWVFYVNRGQAIASFGIENKDHPVMEFEPANKAYRLTPTTGFRTFIKINDQAHYQPFAGMPADGSHTYLKIGANELELQERNEAVGLQVNIRYFTVPGEPFAALARQVTVRNLAATSMVLELLDGMPVVVPYGADNWGLKAIGRTLEAWMEVNNLEQRIAFFKLRASAGDTAEVTPFQAGHFYLAFTGNERPAQLLPPIVDPAVLFAHQTSLIEPSRFKQLSLAELLRQPQITAGKTPCAFFGTAATLPPGADLELYALVGHVSDIKSIQDYQDRLASADYFASKRAEANSLVQSLTQAAATETSSPLFDGYCRQSFLDNLLRGGWPLLLGDRLVYHIYSRKHGDLERDYNDFFLAAEPFSQGNGNYRDVNQNRRSDVLFNPRVSDFNIICFMNLIQADGYNPLVINGSRFTIPKERRQAVLALVAQPEKLASLLDRPFTPGQLLIELDAHGIQIKQPLEAFMELFFRQAEQQFEAVFGEGYWIDHWTYNLDLIESYLTVFPDHKEELLWNKSVFNFYDSPAIVRPRDEKYVLVGDQARQLAAVVEDKEKAAQIATRPDPAHLVRLKQGKGEVYHTTLFVKLLSLALVKFVTMDPAGMGIEMEANKPGWYDALNGLPGLFGSSMPETYELDRLLTFLLVALSQTTARTVSLPLEIYDLMQQARQHLQAYRDRHDPQRDHAYWDATATAREAYRRRIRLGFEGTTRPLSLDELGQILAQFQTKVRAGITRAVTMNKGIPPTYFSYQVTEYEFVMGPEGPQPDEQGRPFIRARQFEYQPLPLFLEGPVRALKIERDPAAAADLHQRVRNSDLFDRQLKMYKVNASLADQPHDIGRARAFSPGWLENESIWMHMEYKYLLALLQAGLYDAFFRDLRQVLPPFMDPAVYGRSPLENVSFIASSAHPDESIHGNGFVARLSGATAEFLSIWQLMMAGRRPFFVQNNQLYLALRPILPGWLFDVAGKISFSFLGQCAVTYHNPARVNTYNPRLDAGHIILCPAGSQAVEITGDVVGPPYAEMVRQLEVKSIDLFFDARE